MVPCCLFEKEKARRVKLVNREGRTQTRGCEPFYQICFVHRNIECLKVHFENFGYSLKQAHCPDDRVILCANIALLRKIRINKK